MIANSIGRPAKVGSRKYGVGEKPTSYFLLPDMTGKAPTENNQKTRE